MGENFNENTSKNIEEKIDESPATKIALANAINSAFIVNSSLDLLFKRFSKFTSDPTSNETVNAAFSGSNGNSETIVIDENETEKIIKGKTRMNESNDEKNNNKDNDRKEIEEIKKKSETREGGNVLIHQIPDE